MGCASVAKASLSTACSDVGVGSDIVDRANLAFECLVKSVTPTTTADEHPSMARRCAFSIDVNARPATCQSMPIDAFEISVRMHRLFGPSSNVFCSWLEQLSSNTRLIKSAEKDEPPGYGSICLTSKDCQHSTTQLECLRGSCVCLEGHVPLGKYLCYNVRGGGTGICMNRSPLFSNCRRTGHGQFNDERCLAVHSASPARNGRRR